MIIPALDLINGHIVRLYQGKYSHQINYDNDPISYLKKYNQHAVNFIHIVDLTRAQSPKKNQLLLLKKILKKISIPIQVGGGIRNENDIDFLFNQGVSRVVLGSAAITNAEKFKKWIKKYGKEKIVLALDIDMSKKRKEVMINAWKKKSGFTLEEIIKKFLPYGLKHVLCTDINRDGTLNGANHLLYQEITSYYPEIYFQASGGVGTLHDIKMLKHSGVNSVIVGRSLLENKFNIVEAIKCWQKELYPV